MTLKETRTINDHEVILYFNTERQVYFVAADAMEVFLDCVQKVKQYEDAEEQRLLLRLPCKVGDKAYYVHKGGIDEVEVDSFIVNVNLFVNVSLYIGCDRFGKILTPYKTLFFTKEAAEAALKKMQEGEE